MKKFFVTAVIMVAAWSCVVTAQQQEPPALKRSISPKGVVEPTRLLLEISYNPTLPPGYSSVNGPEEKAKWIWVTRFTRVPGRPMPPGKPIGAVRLEPVFNGETADVRVTLLRGTPGFDQEDLVGNYQIGIGEQKILSDLEQFGIGPFTITLLDTVPPLPPPPSFDNATKSIEVASVRTENIPKPAYKITFRNNSDKGVRSLSIALTTDGRPGEGVSFQGEEGRALIEPGGVVERTITVIRGVPTPTGYGVGTPAVTIIRIRSAVFDDLSFEGDFYSACKMESNLIGQRFWLKQVLTVLDQELMKSNSNHHEAAKQFKERVLALNYEVDGDERYKVSATAPGCQKPAPAASITMKSLKLNILRELDQIITTRPLPPVNFKSWMQEKRTSFSAWLQRL